MKRKDRVISMLVCTFVGTIFIAPVGVFAVDNEESYLGDDGKMEMQLDRVTKTNDEKNADTDTEETELEKLGITLFTPEAEKTAAEIKAQKKKEMDDVKNSLFTDESTKDNSVQVMKASLFTMQEDVAKSSETTALSQDEPEKKEQDNLVGFIGYCFGSGCVALYGRSKSMGIERRR
ncbi:hypothetical protein PWEIH_01185 [Listeria weihenstephanensis FSL R9-0317]|nr:hypothetical protein PWEIH_01185 [Listeria weihenstephanensis FSL R9-0317]